MSDFNRVLAGAIAELDQIEAGLADDDPAVIERTRQILRECVDVATTGQLAIAASAVSKYIAANLKRA